MKRKSISEITRDPRWQRVRLSLIGQWTSKPDWCCKQLRGYLVSVLGASNDELRIVMNYIVGTAFRIGKIKHKCIQDLRDEISNEIKKRKKDKVWYD